VVVRVGDIMTEQLVTMSGDRPVADGLNLARARRVDLLLLTHHGRLLGVTCVCELRSHAPETLLRDCVHRTPEVIWPESSLQEAANRFAAKGVGCLPVCDGAELVGVLTLRDLERAGLPACLTPGGTGCVVCNGTRHPRRMRSVFGLAYRDDGTPPADEPD
jgi:predicted transcriptional regulator